MLRAGSFIRYQGLGAGEVVDIVERPFRGKKARFAVIRFPHRDLQAQVPAEDPKVLEKMKKLCPARKLRSLLKRIADEDFAQILPRTWDHREKMGKHKLNRGGPEEWVELLASYALAERQGVELVFQDHELVRQALRLTAAELACAEGKPYEEVHAFVEGLYEKASELAVSGDERAHFGSVKDKRRREGEPDGEEGEESLLAAAAPVGA